MISALCCWLSLLAQQSSVWLESLDLDAIEQGWGSPHAARSVEAHPLTLAGKVYQHGVGTHAASEMTIALEQAGVRFDAVVGVDDEVGKRGSIVFAVLVDGKEAWRSQTLRGGMPPATVAVDLARASTMTLVVDDGGDDINYDHADWADAAIVTTGARLPHAVVPEAEPVAMAMAMAPEPAILAPRITGGSRGRPFLFRIPATGAAPLRFAASGLPAGVALDAGTGIIAGALERDGVTDVSVTVTGKAGRATATLTIVCGSRAVALTPPMGWNSWNVWGTAVDDRKVRAAADALVQSGLAAHGYQFLNIDDAWEGTRDTSGHIRSNAKFPDMKALADYVHEKGLKLGIYSSPGRKTCAGYEGSFGHELDDAATWAAWGIDLIKYDWCSYGEIASDQSLAELQKPYRVMRAALDACGRDIVYSLCQYGMGEVWRWGSEVGGNYWRTTGDITDTWSSLSSIGFAQDGHEAYAGPGRWNDPDMLVVGQVGWGPTLHPSRLKPAEQMTHLTLWSLVAAPLLIGCDLTQLDEFTRALLMNPEVLEVDQDALGRPAHRVTQHGDAEVWARPLEGQALAVGLFNRGRAAATITVHWQELGIAGAWHVRNLWTREDEPDEDGAFTASVPRHGAALVKPHARDAGEREMVDVAHDRAPRRGWRQSWLRRSPASPRSRTTRRVLMPSMRSCASSTIR
ncbi:MAG: NPCBM/NEW2 domain-containing protein [Planctomycetota bacterium]